LKYSKVRIQNGIFHLYLKKGFRIEAVLRDYFGEGEDQIMLGMEF
jgi:hypothetical protein